jgi:hypothetical protein
MTHSSLSTMWYFWISLRKQMYALHFCTNAYVEFIGKSFVWENILANIYCKVSKESWVMQSNQDVQVYGMRWIFMVANPNSTMFLKFSLLNLETNVRKHGLSFILFFSLLFSRRASKYPLFWYFKHLSIFSILAFA